MKKRFLICNADDFGFSRGITDAIIDCHANGIITSTTLMTNMPATEYACERSKNFLALGLGVHLTLTEGRPISPSEKVSDLIDEEGSFLPAVEQRKRLWYGKKIAEQVECEFTAQVERALELGIKPTHCDSHHAIHKMPLARQAMVAALRHHDIRSARRSGGYYWVGAGASVGLRFTCLCRNVPMFLRSIMHWWNAIVMQRSGLRLPDRKINREMLLPARPDAKEQLMACLAALPAGISEMVFHPAYLEPDAANANDFTATRRMDTALTRDREIIAALKRYDIKLISFRDM